jgi:hypothetical protein
MIRHNVRHCVTLNNDKARSPFEKNNNLPRQLYLSHGVVISKQRLVSSFFIKVHADSALCFLLAQYHSEIDYPKARTPLAEYCY